MTIHHEPGPVVVCNTCYIDEFGHDAEYPTAHALLVAAKAAGWKRIRVKVEQPGRKTVTMDVCPACQAKGRG